MATPATTSVFSAAGHRLRTTSRRGGFALLITVTLLAFLVLLLVSLASLTRVETQVAANSTQLAQARANALFALNLAMGQLQKYAGPDQAVTARADINSANTGNPFWTGVWDARPPSAATPTHAAAPASNAPMAWLVSGNETNGTAITPAAAPVADPATGNDNVWLVRKALGEELKPTATYPEDGRVKLAKTLIQVPAGQLPGFAAASTTETPVGAYAWWVGDEGIKAKINIADPYRSAAIADPEATWRRSAPARPGLEMLDATKASELKTAFTATTDAFETKRAGLLAYQQFPMLSTNLATTTGVAQAGRYSNDLTSVGYGVLADTLRGGLRRDLTRGLAATPTAGSTAATEIGDSVAVFTLPTPGSFGLTAKSTPSSKHVWTSNAEPPAPTWSEVRAWAGLHAGAGNIMDPLAAPLVGSPCPVPSGCAIMPVPVMLELGYGLDVEPDSKVRFMLRPVVVLMNPYNVSLRSATYSLVYRVTAASSKSDLAYSLIPISGYSGTDANGKPITPPPFNPDPQLTDLVAIDGTPQMAFNITDAFGPGEVKVYSLPASASEDIRIDSTTSIMDLEPGISTVRAYWDNGTVVPGSWYDPAKRDKITVQLGHMPQDCPYLTLSFGKAVSGSMPTPSIYARYVEVSSTIYAKPYPSAKLSTDQARQLRTLRFTLRHAGMDVTNDGASDAGAQGTLGMDLSADLKSGARFLIDNNPRAVLSQRICGRDGVAQFTVSSIKSSSYTDVDYDASNGAALGYWGGGGDASTGSTHAILFDVLRDGEQIVSLGRLGQVNWGVDGKHPAYPLGNSFASIFYTSTTPDFGYALNEAMWDRFFMSTLPVSLATRPANLPDSRLRFHDPAGASSALTALEGVNGYQLAATRLMIDGAFNINSTSTEAWAAFFGSVQAADYAYQGRAGARTDTAVRAFPRMASLHDPDPTAAGQSGNMYEWTGYRQLDATQLKSLAAQIVAGIKTRARPARSLAEFMNRDLSQAATSVRNQEGIVQAAINTVVNTDTPDAVTGNGTGLSNLSGLNTKKIVPAAFANGDNPDAARGKLRATGAPGFLMQNDLLTPLAPAMSARSDTFRVRTYGEVRNPVTGDTNGRAWCEAVVQRMPEFVDQADPNLTDPSKPTTALGNATAPANTNATNQTFGRKFVIVQFRWLGPDEI